MKIRVYETDLSHAGGRVGVHPPFRLTEGRKVKHDAANGRFFANFANGPKETVFAWTSILECVDWM